MNKILQLIGRDKPLFESGIFQNEKVLSRIVSSSRFLVIGGAESIGQAGVEFVGTPDDRPGVGLKSTPLQSRTPNAQADLKQPQAS